MKILDFFPVRDQGDRELGIEIEMEGGKLFPPLLNYWIVTTDNSLRGNPDAAEYVLRAPVKANRVASRIDYLKTTLAAHGAVLTPNDRCGVHVHMNVQKLEFSELFKFCSVYFLFENLLTHWCGEDREGNLFCLRGKDAEALLDGLIQAKANGNITDITNNHYRYAALNFAALQKYGSLEFRAMRTPDDLDRIKIWVKMLLKMRDYAQSLDNDTTIIKDVSSLGPDRLVKAVFGGPLAKHLNNSMLHSQVVDGMDMAQNLAYIPLHSSFLEVKGKSAGGTRLGQTTIRAGVSSTTITRPAYRLPQPTLTQPNEEISRHWQRVSIPPAPTPLIADDTVSDLILDTLSRTVSRDRTE